MKRVLVLGSNSLSGSSFIAEALRKGYEVLAISPSEQPNELSYPTNGQKTFMESKLNTKVKLNFRADINPTLLKFLI